VLAVDNHTERNVIASCFKFPCPVAKADMSAIRRPKITSTKQISPWVALTKMLRSLRSRALSLSQSRTKPSRTSSASSRPMSSLPSTRPPSWKSTAPPPIANTVTFAAQSALPKLPVPELNATLTKLKASLKPLAWSEEEFKEAERKIDEFAGKEGKVLQERLLKRREETQHWLEQWWDDGGYLGYRDSVCPLCSPQCTYSHIYVGRGKCIVLLQVPCLAFLRDMI
jgi:hypothetical protein